MTKTRSQAPGTDPAVAPFTVIQAGRERWEAGVDVVLAAQAATGLPDPGVWPPDRFAVHTRERQGDALGVWLALAGDVTVGHALLKAVPREHRDWSHINDAAVTKALNAGNLVEMGGLAVCPQWQGRGVAGALVRARLTWVAQHPEMLVVASIWDHSPGSGALARRYARLAGHSAGGPYALFVYDL